MTSGSFKDWILNEVPHVGALTGAERIAIIQDAVTKYCSLNDLSEIFDTGGAVETVNAQEPDSSGNVILTKADISLGNVDNTSDISKPISNATQTALNLKIDASQLAQPNGPARLGNDGKLPVAQLPAAVLGAANYQGTWNATSNTPSLSSGVGSKGIYYIVSTAGATNLNGITDWKIGDWAIFDGTAWQKVDNTDAVTSVNGQQGIVVLAKSDVGLSNVDNTSDATKPISTATATALATKQASLVSGTNIKTVNGNTILGAGDLVVGGAPLNVIVPMAKNNRLAMTGTSAVAGSDGYACMLFFIEPRLQRTRDMGLSGQQSRTMANRFHSTVTNFNPGFILIDAGRNDLGSALEPTKRMIEEARKTGAIALVSNSWGEITQTGSHDPSTYNAALKAYCNPANGVDGPGATDPGIIFLDIFSTMFNSNGTNKFALAQSAAVGTNSSGATVINVANASLYTAGTGQFVWSANGEISKPCVILARDTSANTITISRPTTGAITSGAIIYSHPYFNDGDHPSGSGSIIMANYVKGVLASAGVLNAFQKPRSPLLTVTAAEMTAGATENIFGRFATLEGTVTSGLHEGILTNLTGNCSVITDSDFRGKAQQFTVPAGTAAGKALMVVDSALLPPSVITSNLAGRLIGFHMKFKAAGWQNAGGLYRIRVDGGGFGHFIQFSGTPGVVAIPGLGELPELYYSGNIINDGTFEVWGSGYAPTDLAESGLGITIDLPTAMPAGVTPPTFIAGEFGLWDIDEVQLPRRWIPRSRTVTANSTLLVTDEVVWINAAGATNITLPVPSGQVLPMVRAQPLKLINIGAGTATIIGTVDGVVNTTTIASGASKLLFYDMTNSNWKS